MIPGPRKILRAAGSLWLTLACVALAAALLVHSRVVDAPVGASIALPFALLGVNLLAALLTNPKLRQQGGLLVFHLALAGVASLAAVGSLVSLNGHVEVTEGAAFNDRLVEAEAGPLHPWRLSEVRFTQGDFVINYGPGMKRRETVSRIIVPDGRQGQRRVDVGDDRPLVVDGYRFYTSFNKGFAPVLTYVDATGRAHSGAVHLPSYPINYYKQGNTWMLPDGSREVKLWLRMPKPILSENESWQFHKPDNAVLVVIDGSDRRELRPGEAVSLKIGELRYESLGSWMGYTISYDPTTPWMVAAAIIGAIGLAWHIVAKVRWNSWQATGE